MTAHARPRVVTLGCRLNAFESQVMRGHLAAAGLDDVVVINTCTVTAEAERQARQAIRREKRRHPGKRIVVTGCAAQLDPDRFAAMPEVDRVIGNGEKMAAATFRDLATAPLVQVADVMGSAGDAAETVSYLIQGFEGRARAFVQVQQGCDHRCTFCIIPFARGPNRSLGLGAIVQQVRALVEAGFAEVVLTGVDICSYGADLPGRPRLGATVQRLLDQVPELRRLRLGSLDPAAMDDELYRLLAEEPRFMPHLHLSLQTLDDVVLKRMKRRHSVADAFAVAARARAARPDVALGADLIAGFPTETAAMAANTLAAAADLGLTHLHVFPYSERAGTPAARSRAARALRSATGTAGMRAAGDGALAGFCADRIDTEAAVLVERDRDGLSEHYLAATVDADVPPGTVVRGAVAAVADGRLEVRAA